MQKLFLASLLLGVSLTTVSVASDVDLAKGKFGRFGVLKSTSRSYGEDEITRAKAEKIVLQKFESILKSTTRKARILDSYDDDIIVVEITELGGSPFYKVNIDRNTGMSATDEELLKRENKIDSKVLKEMEYSAKDRLAREKSSSKIQSVIEETLVNENQRPTIRHDETYEKPKSRIIFSR